MRLVIYPHGVQDSVPLLYSAEDVNGSHNQFLDQELESPQQEAPQYHIERREKTPAKEPGATPDHVVNGPPGTRRDATLALSFKAPDFIPKVNRKMEDKWCERTFTSMEGLVPGSNPTKTQLNKLVKSLDIKWEGMKEKDMYPILCNAFNTILYAAKANCCFKDVADWRENDFVDMRPDLVMYPKAARARSAYALGEEEMSRQPKERQKHMARCAWGWMMAFVECKEKGGDSAFYFSQANKKKLLRAEGNGPRCRAQIAKYAAEMQIRQHRTHVWSFYFCGSQVRLQRWDRAGCMVSEALDLNVQQDKISFINFLYRFARLTPEQLGYDSTATLATPREVKMIREYASDIEALNTYKEHMLVSEEDFPIYKVIVQTYVDDLPEAAGQKRRTTRSTVKTPSLLRPTKLTKYLIGQPVDCHSSTVGRATKGYVGLDTESGRLVFIKDQWRAVAPGAHPEIETYERLRKHKVACVATCLGGGDVVSKDKTIQRTLTHELLPPNANFDNSERYHTRLVIKEVGLPLDEYPNSPELITIVYHALIGHCEAWEHAEVLHRDLSPGNIMIDVESPKDFLTGFLTDWDMCKYKIDLVTNVPAMPGRSGTWPYLSTLCLVYPKKPQEVADDLEAIVYILVRMALRFHRHTQSLNYPPEERLPDDIRNANATNEDLATLVSSFFDVQIECEDGYWSGGTVKKNWLQNTGLPVELSAGPDGSVTPLASLLESLYALLRQHYGAINYADLERFSVGKKKLGSTLEADVGKEQMTEGKDNVVSEPLVAQKPVPPPKTVDALTRINSRMTRARDEEEEDSSDDDDEETPPPKPVPKEPSNRISVVTIPNPRRVLDTHEEIIKVFGHILFKNKRKTKARDLSRYNHDKWYDQFDGLKAALNLAEMNPSGNTVKRKKVYHLYEEVWEEGRRKRVRGSTYRVHIPYTVVEQPEQETKLDTNANDESE